MVVIYLVESLPLKLQTGRNFRSGDGQRSTLLSFRRRAVCAVYVPGSFPFFGMTAPDGIKNANAERTCEAGDCRFNSRLTDGFFDAA